MGGHRLQWPAAGCDQCWSWWHAQEEPAGQYLCYFCHLACLISWFRQKKTGASMLLHVWLSGQCFKPTYETNELRLCRILLLDSLSADIMSEGCLTQFLSEMSACCPLLWLMHVGTCRTSTSAGVQQWCCRCAWQMKGWPWRAASGMGSRMKCCAVCVSWSTPVNWPWR